MISRYAREEMSALWRDKKRFEVWYQVEVLACEAMAEVGLIPKEAAERIKKKKIDVDIGRILEIELKVKHDVIAFLTFVAEQVGDDAKYIHQGLTSSDIIDTSLGILLSQACDILIRGLSELLETLGENALQYKDTIMIGRSHGMHGEPITLGLKFTVWYEEIKRNIDRMQHAKRAVSVGKISGAMGQFANIPMEVEEYVCKHSGLEPEPASTQIVQRDRHAEFLTTLAITASSLDKFATEIRHLQRTEVAEVEEFFSKGQKGSSAMPHKRNPIGSENISGLARVIRGNALAAMENIALWHERDISHSSVERIIIPDSTIALDFMIHRMTSILKSLVVYPENMLKNLNLSGGRIYSQRLMLQLISSGMQRNDAYELIQKNAMQAFNGESSFEELVRKDEKILSLLTEKEIDGCFDNRYYIRNIDKIFNRVFNPDYS